MWGDAVSIWTDLINNPCMNDTLIIPSHQSSIIVPHLFRTIRSKQVTTRIALLHSKYFYDHEGIHNRDIGDRILTRYWGIGSFTCCLTISLTEVGLRYPLLSFLSFAYKHYVSKYTSLEADVV